MTGRDLVRLDGVHPRLITILQEVYILLAGEGYTLFVVEGVRTVARQHQLWVQGRTAPGKIVTYKDGIAHKSNHQPHADGFGYAVDCAFTPTAKIGDPFSEKWPWAAYGDALEARGALWGGRWAMGDLPHAELQDVAILGALKA